MPGPLVERGEVGVGDLPDVEVLDGLLREREEPGAQAVALVLLAVDEPVLVERAQQPQGRGLVDAEALGDLPEVGGAPREQRQDAERPVDGLAHGVRTPGRPPRGRGPAGPRPSARGLLVGLRPVGAEVKCPPGRVVERGQAVGQVAAGRDGQVAGDREGGGGRQVPVTEPAPEVEAAEGRGEETGGEGVPGADRRDDVDAGAGTEVAVPRGPHRRARRPRLPCRPA